MAICLNRVLDRLDEYFAKNDIAAAERHLCYWYEEARAEGDLRSLFALTNELIGFHRKQGNREKALEYSKQIIALCRELKLEGTVSEATACINAATACKAFGHAQEALPLFRKAKEIYEKQLEPEDPRLGGLYNNMGLALCDVGEFEEAGILYRQALAVMKNREDGQPDAAVTCLNMADAAEQEQGFENAKEEIRRLLEEARRLLDSRKTDRSGYYAFVCEKCAPAFRYYGETGYARELKERAESIYEGT